MAKSIPNLAILTQPLRALLEKETEFEWNKNHQQAFDDIKTAIAKESTLNF